MTGLRDATVNSSKSLTSHVTSEVAMDMTLYSSLKEDLEIMCCFLLFQQIGEFPRRITYLVIDLLNVGQDAQFESK